MDDLRSICYENSFLNQVIVRLDFLQSISSSIVIDTDLENRIIQHFPRKGKDQITWVLMSVNNFCVIYFKGGMSVSSGHAGAADGHFQYMTEITRIVEEG